MMVKAAQPCTHTWGEIERITIQKCEKCGTVERVAKNLCTEVVIAKPVALKHAASKI